MVMSYAKVTKNRMASKRNNISVVAEQNYWLVKLVTAYRNPGMVVRLRPSERGT